MLVVCSDIDVLGSPLIVVTRIQDLASEFSKKFPATPSRIHPSSACGRVRGKRPGVGIQTLVPLNFSAVVAPTGLDYGSSL